MQYELRDQVARFLYTDPNAQAILHAGSKENEDAVQVAVLSLSLADKVHNPDGSVPSGYIYRTVRNAATDQHRATLSRPQAVGPDISEHGDAVVATGDIASGVVRRMVVIEALGRLSREHSTVLYMMHYEGYSQEEIAKKLGIPAGTVKSRSSYGMRALRQILTEQGINNADDL